MDLSLSTMLIRRNLRNVCKQNWLETIRGFLVTETSVNIILPCWTFVSQHFPSQPPSIQNDGIRTAIVHFPHHRMNERADTKHGLMQIICKTDSARPMLTSILCQDRRGVAVCCFDLTPRLMWLSALIDPVRALGAGHAQ